MLWLTGRLYTSRLVPAHADLGVAARLSRRARRLVHRRGRPPALDRLRRVAHGRRGIAGPRRQRARLAHSVRARLRHRVRRRPLLHCQARAARTRRRRRRSRRRARRTFRTGQWQRREIHDRNGGNTNDGVPARDPAAGLGGDPGARGVSLRAARRLRPRPRRAVPARALAQGPRRHDELGRALLGRQRDLARARRRRPARRLPARLCRHAAGALHSRHPHADRADPARRRLRVPLQVRSAIAGPGTSPSPSARCLPR